MIHYHLPICFFVCVCTHACVLVYTHGDPRTTTGIVLRCFYFFSFYCCFEFSFIFYNTVFTLNLSVSGDPLSRLCWLLGSPQFHPVSTSLLWYSSYTLLHAAALWSLGIYVRSSCLKKVFLLTELSLQVPYLDIH